MTELLPCPFCGGEAELHPTYDMDTNEVDGWFVWCDNDTCECKPETGQFFTEAEAIAAWNSRAAMEFDNWFYLPKPKEPIVEVTETMHAWDGTKVKTDVFYQVQEQAVINWAKELDEHIIKRICEVWNTRADYHGYEQAAVDAWKRVKAYQERTCRNVDNEFPYFKCSECGCNAVVGYGSSGDGLPNYCPNCGAKVVGE